MPYLHTDKNSNNSRTRNAKTAQTMKDTKDMKSHYCAVILLEEEIRRHWLPLRTIQTKPENVLHLTLQDNNNPLMIHAGTSFYYQNNI